MPADLSNATIGELRRLLDRREVSAAELAQSFVADIRKRDGKYGAFLEITESLALAQADLSDRRLKEGKSLGPLDGIPVAVKDVILVEGTTTTAGSKFLKNFIAPFDATVAARLRSAGALFVGKTNCDEFAMGSSNENSAHGVVRNPWDTTRVPGGSSGGSAACVAAREVPAALGTDTGGSIRQPAALCGIVGLKPTYGRVSRYGVVAFASSLDQVGPMTRKVEDNALLFETIAGNDPRDSTSARNPVDSGRAQFGQSIVGLRIGVPKEYLPSTLSSDVRENFTNALKELERLGAVVEEISLPHTEYAIACYYIVATAEASANLARYDGVRYTARATATNLDDLYTQSRSDGFGPEVRRRIMLGTFVLSAGYYDAYYLKAQKVRTLLRNDFANAFSRVDVVACPTSPTAAFPLGSKTANPMEMYLSDIFTVSISMAGLPALAVPSGFTKENLPLGIQLIGKAFEEATIYRAAHAYECATKFFERRPPL